MRFKSLAVVTSVLTYLTILLGGYTRGSGAGLGCGDAWPLCRHPDSGTLHWFPDWSRPLMVIEWSHRFVALFAGIAILATAVQAWRTQRHDRRLLGAATLAAILLPLQAFLGAVTVWEHLEPVWSATHMGVASALFAAVVATVIFAFYPGRPSTDARAAPTEPGPGGGQEPAGTVADYAQMTKPRIVALLAAMGFTGMVLAGGWPALPTAFWTLVGGALGAAAGGVVNQVLERDLDAAMDRTSDRPLASGRVSPQHALVFAGVLGATSFTMLAFMVNVLAAVLTLLAVLFYVFIYTMWLKPSTPQGVVVGGAAGAAPALVGWAGVTGGLGAPAVLLGLLVFLWTPPHFWALAIARREEYDAAGFPMMPVSRGIAHTKRRMVAYTVATVLAASLFYALGYLGTLFLVVSTVLGAVFLGSILYVVVDHTPRRARRAFTVSVAYLFLVFVAILADRLVGWPL